MMGSDSVVENSSIAVLNSTSDVSGQERGENTRRKIARLVRDRREMTNDKRKRVAKNTVG